MELATVAFMTSAWAGAGVIVGIILTGAIILTGIWIDKKVGCILSVIGAILTIVLAAVGLVWVDKNIDQPRTQANIAAAVGQLQPLQEQISAMRFPLKEMAHNNGFHGEISGEFTRFLVGASGSVYGQVDNVQQLTLIYYDEETAIDTETSVWKVRVFPLEKVTIVTIPADEDPYLKFSAEIRVEQNRAVLIVAETLTLYLPEGWELVGNYK